MTALEALRDAGLTAHDARVEPRPGTWEPVGIVVHHYGDLPPKAYVTPPTNQVRVCQEGRADLDGPLYPWLIDGEGAWWWITDGRANHAGAGDSDVMTWLQSPDARLPDPPAPNKPDDYRQGNRMLEGVCVVGNGNWPAHIHESLQLGLRALIAYRGYRRDNAIGHKEWTTRKPDPGGVDMHGIRAWLRDNPTPPPLPTPEDDMPRIYLSDDDADDSQVLVDGGLVTVIVTGQDSATLHQLPGATEVKVSTHQYAEIKRKAKQ